MFADFGLCPSLSEVFFEYNCSIDSAGTPTNSDNLSSIKRAYTPAGILLMCFFAKLLKRALPSMELVSRPVPNFSNRKSSSGFAELTFLENWS